MNKRIKMLTLLLVVALMAAVAGPAIASSLTREATLTYRDIRITLDGQELEPTDVNGTYVEPFIIDGTTYLPVRGIASALDLDVNWDGATNTISLETGTSSDPVVETVGPDGVKLSNDASDFVVLSEAVPDAILEIRYYSTYNFIGDRIDGYEAPVALLTREAAAALKAVSDDLIARGYRLKIYDAYRPQMAVTHFMNWALDLDDTRMKEYFYPELEKDVLFAQGYIAEHSGHSRGSTVDLTLFDMTTEKEVDMGGTFDYFGQLSHPDYQGITQEQYANRMILREAMMAHGFRPLEEEWWHFTLENEPYPDTYFTFPIRDDWQNTNITQREEPAGDGIHASIQHVTDSPAWIQVLPAARDETVTQLFVVAGMGMDKTTATVSMHERDETGQWKQILSTPAYVGRNGLCMDADHAEGCGQTPIGIYSFNAAFGIASDPGCAIPYTQVTEDTWWSGDEREGMHYNQMVNIQDYPDLDLSNSEHIVDYEYQYQYCLNISFNEDGTPGRGSAIFLHCLGPVKPYTGGCVAIPENIMKLVMQNVHSDCVVVIDTLEGLGGSL